MLPLPYLAIVKRRIAGIVVALLCLASQAQTAQATNDPDNIVPTDRYNVGCYAATQAIPKNVCQTDNASVSVWYQQSLTTQARSKVNDTLGNDFQTTDLNISYPSSAVYTGSGETDIIYQQGALINDDLAGITWCDDDTNGEIYKCDQQVVRFAEGTLVLKTACHESGHAVGLTHGENADPETVEYATNLGCMGNTGGSLKTLGTNVRGNINSVY